MPSRSVLIPLLMLVAVLSGCDTMNWEQYRISGVVAGSQDAERLKVLVMAVAKQHGLEDVTPTSHVPETLVFVKEPGVENFHTDIGVRFYGGDALVDVMAGFGPKVPKFTRVRNELAPALAVEFGERYAVLIPPNRVQVK